MSKTGHLPAVVTVAGLLFTTGLAGSAQADVATATRIQDSASTISYSGAWTTVQDASASGGTIRSTGQTGAAATHTFTGASVKVYTQKAPNAGIMDVYVDGRQVRSFDAWAPAVQYGVVAYRTASLPLGRHTVEVRHSGRRNASATGGQVRLDHIDTTDRVNAQAYADQGFGLFVHYGINTYNGKTGWVGDPRDYPSTLFNPPHFDPDRWAAAAEAAGMRYLVYTAKHHYGWSGWPTAHGSEPKYNVSTSSTPNLDTVGRVVTAARAHNLKPVLYYSLLDRYNYFIGGNNKNAAYTRFVRDQLSELLDGTYGDIPALWFDIGDALTAQQRQEITAHARALRPGITIIINFTGDQAAPEADLHIYEGLGHGPAAGAIDPTTSDRATTQGTRTCDPGRVAGWWSFDDNFTPGCIGWTRASTLPMRNMLNARNSTFTLNVSPGPNGRLSTQAEDYLRSLRPADDRAATITYTGEWLNQARAEAHLGTLKYASTAGASARFSFTGTSVTVETKLGPGAGIMNILIDGQKVATVDTWSPTIVDRAVAYQVTDLPAGEHTITVVATGAKNPQSGNTSVHLDSIQHH